MANLDMQRIVFNEIVENEREEIELTELVPVKRSRIIRDNDAFETDNVKANAETVEEEEEETGATAIVEATDALKVLRSFGIAGECEEEDAGKQSRGHRRGDKSRKEIDEYGKGSNGCEIEPKETIADRTYRLAHQRAGFERRKKRVDNEDAKSSKKRTTNGGIRAGNEQAKEGNKEKKEKRHRRASELQDFLGHERKNLSVEYNEEPPTYLDLDKNVRTNEEIYVFRREPLFFDSEQKRNANAGEIYEDEYPSGTTDGPLFDRMAISSRETSESVVETIVDAIVGEKLGKRNSNVRGNFVEQGENNNSVGSNTTKLFEDLSPSRKRGEIVRAEDRGNEDRNGDDDADTCRDEGEQKKYRCAVCEARFKGSGGLRNHYKIVHGAGPVFKCDECGKEFPLKERLKLHVRTHTGFKPYKCSECDKSFARGGQLVQHRRTHSQVKPYRCALCSGTFTCAANLALHVKRHNGQKDHECEICGRAFVRRDALKKHLECLHRDVKSFLCVICNKTFKGHLPQHMRTHARDRPHGCATCGQRFAQKSQLTVHQRTHSGQRPFRCLVCWQAFAHSTALKLHTRRHTGERPFKCAECNAGFTQLPHWKKHMKCIHGRNEPYACKKCKSFFRIKNDLESHEKTCHPEFAIDRDYDHDHDHDHHHDHDHDHDQDHDRDHEHEHEHDRDHEREHEHEQESLRASPECSRSSTNASPLSNQIAGKRSPPPSKYRLMTVERMRLLLAVLLKRISKQERLDELGFGKRLIDEVLHDSLVSAGKDPVASDGLSELEILTRNLEIFLKWTVPKEHWEHFRRLNKSPEDILETLTAT
ncbi:uncharacterized protein LOC100881985 [Megachile rotundata]|uniref:uncharacterized protein LOC100881985 n=1 Tax=Megachile rotundata TaxID=143995 RepID=UPI003FD139C4